MTGHEQCRRQIAALERKISDLYVQIAGLQRDQAAEARAQRERWEAVLADVRELRETRRYF